MLGNIDVHDEALARAAAGGDRDAFGTLFERHLGPVFTAAWFVLRDRAVAAEIVRDTFMSAWQHAGAVAPEDFADSLVTSADHKAHAWLKENPQGVAVANTIIPDDPPAIGPVLRARIVTALEVQGVPTKARVDSPPEPQLDLGPGRPHRERMAPQVRGLLAHRRQLGIAGAAALILLVGAVVAFGGGDAGGEDPGGTETAAGDDEPGRASVGNIPWEPISEDEDEAADDDSRRPTTTTTTTASSTTESTPAGDGDGEAAAPDASATRVNSPATTTRPPSPPPTPGPTAPTTPTTAAPSGPRIISFTGTVVGSCSGGVNYRMTWKTSGGSWVWIWPSSDPDPWQDVGGPGDGSATRCTHYGETWNIATRHDGTHDNDWREVRASRVV